MKLMILRRSLARRLFVTLILAFFATCLILTAKDVVLFYLDEAQADGGSGKTGAVLASSLDTVSERSNAIAIVKAVEDLFNASYQGSGIDSELNPWVVVQLATRSGELLYESDALGHLLGGDARRVQRITVKGHPFDLFSYDTARWSLRLGFPRFRKHKLFAAIFTGLAPYLAISFPIVMIPLWLGIRSGLKPLDRLSQVLARRRDDDLSPLALDMKYGELEHVAEAIESLMQRLRQKIDNERVFIQDAAHELRTPMAVISAQAHVLAHAENPDSREQAESALGDAIARASHLSEQLLSLASLDHARHLEKVPLDLAFLLQNLLAQMAVAAAARHIDLALEAPDSLLVPMNRVAFHSIVQNLVVNALRYGLEGGHVIVSLSADEKEVLLRVADDGPGISRADRGHIFDRFFRGKVQNVTGTGLGLAIVAKATRAVGGLVRVEDGIEGRGVAFVVSFPRSAAHS